MSNPPDNPYFPCCRLGIPGVNDCEANERCYQSSPNGLCHGWSVDNVPLGTCGSASPSVLEARQACAPQRSFSYGN